MIVLNFQHCKQEYVKVNILSKFVNIFFVNIFGKYFLTVFFGSSLNRVGKLT